MRKIVIGIILVFLVIGGYFFFNQIINSGPQDTSVVIRTTKMYWPGAFWLEIAQEKGWFKEAGLTVELNNVSNSYYKSLQDTADGKLDANVFSLYDFVLFNGKGADLVAVIHLDISNGINGIVANPNIRNIASLKGKKVAVVKGGFGEYLLAAALEKNGLTLADVITINSTGDGTELDQMLANGSVDAIVTYEPFISEAIKQNRARKLFDDGAEVLGIGADVITFNRSFIQKHPKEVQNYVNVWHKTTTYMKEHPDEAYGIIAKNYNVTVDDVATFVKSNKILELEDNKTSFLHAAGYSSLHGGFKMVNRFMIENNIIDKQLDSSLYFDNTFINNLE